MKVGKLEMLKVENIFFDQFEYEESIFGLYFQLFKLSVSRSFYGREVGMWVLWLL